MRRAIVFLFVFILLAGLVGGLSYFQFVFKPTMIKNFIAKAPRPAQTVAATTAKREKWAREVTSIGTFTAVEQINVAPEIGGIISAIRFRSGEDVKKGQVLLK